ncbi:4-hydroxy-tetrahydrodipicolinate reductase [Legionella israelensis]|uniref:4-hydroxy-tetrahydrodipicolinate reductase n=1 Tax=Legionella israelensis TaxID=454 RepID=UPI00117CBFB8|nr:4-hydroxy-tetrahydrodipicolinate reductase [Legionella israelensis]QDP71352.1 4-hydroxy-tetrahydrodipicolinate reductase [Legionella israelensis]
MRVIVNGARGKMGSLACDVLDRHPDFTLVAALGREDNLGEAIEQNKAGIVVDLTNADSVYVNSKIIIEHGAHPVIGTSGLMDEQIKELQSRCEQLQLGGLVVPNFSISAVLMVHFAAIASSWMSEVEIIEMHHQQKLDAPSGTALKTAEIIAAARKSPRKQLSLKELIPAVRGGRHEDINIHSLRLPGVLARQQVIFGHPGETLSITHDSIDRTSFMPGLLLACQKVDDLKTLHYGLETLLDL